MGLMERATIDFLFLARHAEAANGLLTVVGGACTELKRSIGSDKSVPLSHFGIAVSIAIPWTETNKPHNLRIRIVNEDETETLVHGGTHQFNIGRPPTIAPGTVQHVVLGIGADVIFPCAGGYCAIAELDAGTTNTEADIRKWAFTVRDVHPIILTPID